MKEGDLLTRQRGFDEATELYRRAIDLDPGASRIDFFSNHGRVVNGYKQYLSSPYTRVELGPSRH